MTPFVTGNGNGARMWAFERRARQQQPSMSLDTKEVHAGLFFFASPLSSSSSFQQKQQQLGLKHRMRSMTERGNVKHVIRGKQFLPMGMVDDGSGIAAGYSVSIQPFPGSVPKGSFSLAG